MKTDATRVCCVGNQNLPQSYDIPLVKSIVLLYMKIIQDPTAFIYGALSSILCIKRSAEPDLEKFTLQESGHVCLRVYNDGCNILAA